MLRAGLIRHTVNKMSFSEQCYYTLAPLETLQGCTSAMSSLTLDGGIGTYITKILLKSGIRYNDLMDLD